MKYVMLQIDRGGDKIHVPVIFPDTLVHEYVAQAIQACCEDDHEMKVDCVISAGECNVFAECSGFSTSLDLKSLPGDDVVINSYDYCHGDPEISAIMGPQIMALMRGRIASTD